MKSAPTYQRERRLEEIKRWSEEGVLKRRTPMLIEKQFADLIDRKASWFFKPVVLQNFEDGDVEFHRELSYLLDAFDSLPYRPDQAFDSTWKALELEIKQSEPRNITDGLATAVCRVDPGIVAAICGGVPVQTCEWAYTRLVVEFLEGNADAGLAKRVENQATAIVTELLEVMRKKYGVASLSKRREGAMFLRGALKGETLSIEEDKDLGIEPNPVFRLDESSQAQILGLLVLYTLRNERIHGSSFSPFLSSYASLKTYTHPYFAFLATYYLLVGLWLARRPEVLIISKAEILASFNANLQEALRVFGRHWEK